MYGLDHSGNEAEPLPEGCTLKEVKKRGAGDTAWVVLVIDDAVSVVVQWEPDQGICLARAQSLASFVFHAVE